VIVEVRDGGPGLSADDLVVAFQPAALFTRYKGVRKVGSGVGLALVGTLAARLGGVAEAGAAPEGGARFAVRLPSSLDVGRFHSEVPVG
jgi:two-component system OmpR family sensor kinase